MAISAPVFSTEYLAQNSNPPFTAGLAETPTGVLIERAATLKFTAAGFTSAAAGDISLLRIPPGKIRLRLAISQLTCPAGTATSDLDIGISAYTKWDGTTQALQGNLIADSLDVGGGALSQAPATSDIIVDSYSGFSIVCSFDTANSPASGTLILRVFYHRES